LRKGYGCPYPFLFGKGLISSSVWGQYRSSGNRRLPPLQIPSPQTASSIPPFACPLSDSAGYCLSRQWTPTPRLQPPRALPHCQRISPLPFMMREWCSCVPVWGFFGLDCDARYPPAETAEVRHVWSGRRFSSTRSLVPPRHSRV
jgi:hypothetical protein